MARKLVIGLMTAALILSFSQLLCAQTAGISPSPATDTAARLAILEQQAAEAKGSADNAGMLTSAALVLMLTGPGLALSYGGLVPKKNLLGTMLQSFSLMAVITILWGLFSYGVCFRAGNSFIGGLQNVFLKGVGAVAGLVAITPASGFLKPTPALIIGLLAGVCCYWMVAKVKAKFGYDDSLDACGVHGAGGTLGAMLTGVFAASAVNPLLQRRAEKYFGLRPDRWESVSAAQSAGWASRSPGCWRLWARSSFSGWWTSRWVYEFPSRKKCRAWISPRTAKRVTIGKRPA
jgi:Ammonium Transporter Family